MSDLTSLEWLGRLESVLGARLVVPPGLAKAVTGIAGAAIHSRADHRRDKLAPLFLRRK